MKNLLEVEITTNHLFLNFSPDRAQARGLTCACTTRKIGDTLTRTAFFFLTARFTVKIQSESLRDRCQDCYSAKNSY